MSKDDDLPKLLRAIAAGMQAMDPRALNAAADEIERLQSEAESRTAPATEKRLKIGKETLVHITDDPNNLKFRERNPSFSLHRIATTLAVTQTIGVRQVTKILKKAGWV